MTAHRKRPAADWEPRDLYVGGDRLPTVWEAYRVPLCALLLLLVGLVVVWLLRSA